MADEEERKSASPIEEIMDIDEDSAEDGEEEEEDEEEEEEDEEMEISIPSSPTVSTPQGPIVLSLGGRGNTPKGRCLIIIFSGNNFVSPQNPLMCPEY